MRPFLRLSTTDFNRIPEMNQQLGYSDRDVHVEDTEGEGGAGLDLLVMYDLGKCLSCAHLIKPSTTDAKRLNLTEYMDCHYSNGNVQCPASQLAIVKRTDTLLAASRFSEALSSGNMKRMSKIINRIASKDSHTQSLIMNAINVRLSGMGLDKATIDSLTTIDVSDTENKSTP